MNRFFHNRPPSGGALPVHSLIIITGGTYAGHEAEILGVTEKMYHILLDTRVVTKIKHSHARLRENQVQTSTPRQQSGTITPRADDARAETRAPRQSYGVTPPSEAASTRRRTRSEYEATIEESLEGIRDHVLTITYCLEQLRMG